MAAGPVVNGEAYDFGSIRIKIDGDTYIACTAASYSDPMEPGELFGTHAQAIGFTDGQIKPTASITLEKANANILRKKLAEIGATKQQGYKQVRFDVVVNYEVPGLLDLITDEIIGCRVVDDANSHQSGTDGLVETWSLKPRKLIKDGVESVYDPLY